MATVSTEANHRSGPGTGYQSFGVVYGNPTVKMLARNDNPSEIWLKVELPDGRIAWMARSVLLANDSDIETLSVEIVPAPTAAPAATQASAAQQAQAQPAGRLAVQRKDGTNDEATCLAFEVIGQNATGWSVKVDGTRLSGVFDQRNARLCGLSPNQEVTFSIYFANGDRVPGGRGVPARGGEVFSGYWTR
jgi:SH3-like domain-containing protein